MRPFVSRMINAGSDAPRAPAWCLIGCLGICGLGFAFVATTVNLDPSDQPLPRPCFSSFAIAGLVGLRPCF
jgi:hypothetical protein